MDNELNSLWLGPQDQPKENIDMIIETVLQDAGTHRDHSRTVDIVCGVVTALLIPYMVRIIRGSSGMYARAGLAVLMLGLIGSLAAFWLFYRKLRSAPPPTRSVREHLAYSLEYLNRRERHFRLTHRAGTPLMLLAALVFALSPAGTRGARMWAVTAVGGAVAGHVMTKAALKRIEESKSKLQSILEDC
jgi:hypothetical protein